MLNSEWIPLGPVVERENVCHTVPQRLSACHRFWKHSLGRAGVVLLCPILLLLILGPSLSGYSYDAVHLSMKNQSPSAQFWFGTDDLGRDIFTRIWYGARVSISVGLLAALIDLGIGLLWEGSRDYQEDDAMKSSCVLLMSFILCPIFLS